MTQAEQVKRAQMDLLAEIDRICRKHDLKYSLIAGTLLGAIRHDGFIPWDDDLDIAMMRADYDRMLGIMKTELDSAYFVHDWYSDPASPHSFTKLKIRDTHYPEDIAQGSAMNDSIFIDIFPYDFAPESKLIQKIQGFQLYFLKKIMLLRCGFNLSGGSVPKKILYGLLKSFSKIRSVENWKKSFRRAQRIDRYPDSRFVICTCGVYSYRKEIKPRDFLEGYMNHRFESGEFMILEKYDAWLRSHYGNYMQLPPEDQRVGRHDVIGIDFGDYKIRYNGTIGGSGEEVKC